MYKDRQIKLSLDEKKFNRYLYKRIMRSHLEKLFLTELLKRTDVIIFGGVIRDYYFDEKKTQPRDIDLVVTNFDDTIVDLIEKYLIKKNSFGGYRLKINNRNYDLWSIENTWAIKNSPAKFSSREESLPSTSFFNITAIAYSIKQQRFLYQKDFFTGYHKRILDIVFEENPYPELCFIKTYEYYNRYNLSLSVKLRNYLKNNYETSKDKFINIQNAHYGHIKYKDHELDDFFRTKINLSHTKNVYFLFKGICTKLFIIAQKQKGQQHNKMQVSLNNVSK